MITKDMIEKGMECGAVLLTVDPIANFGTVCTIGNGWFYFGGETAEEMLPEKYMENVPMEDIVNEIFMTLKDFAYDIDFAEEYEYYEIILKKEIRRVLGVEV